MSDINNSRDSSNMELTKYFLPMRYVVYSKDLINDSPHYEYGDSFLDGTLITELVQSHGIDKLKEIINFHNIEHKHNIIAVFQKSDFIQKLIAICKPNNKKSKLPNGASYFVNENWYIAYYSHILEYFILNYKQEHIEYIIEEIQTDPGKLKWDYLNKNLVFGKKDTNPDIEHIIFSTIMKIIIENDTINESYLANTLVFFLQKYLLNSTNSINDIYIKNKIEFLLITLKRTENEYLFEKVKTLIKTMVDAEKPYKIYNHVTFMVKEIAFELDYYYDIIF
jgi:hypothetical protein